MNTEILTLQNGQQRLQVAPELGAGLTGWHWHTATGEFALLRPWDGASPDRYTLASFPLLPWSNRITQGGFAHQGVHYAIAENRAGEPYPIHGDGWLQPWQVASQAQDSLVLTLQSRRHNGNPWEYDAQQSIVLHEDGMTLSLKATHRGRTSMPYGLGLHPYFPCNAATRLQAKATGVWLSGPDPIPISHSSSFPPGWDYNEPAPLTGGGLIDNCFTGWDGVARIAWPDQHLALTMTTEGRGGTSLLYRPPDPAFFCFEPITHPIDAFHMKGRPGLVTLAAGESVVLEVRFTVGKLAA